MDIKGMLAQVTEMFLAIGFKNEIKNTILKDVYEAMMKAERQVFLDACCPCTNKANGYYSRTTNGLHEPIEIQVPRDRAGEFRPATLDEIESQDTKLRDLAYKLYVHGLTTRDIENIIGTTFGQKISAATVSNITKAFETEREAWLNKALDEEYLFIYIDALFVPVRRDSVAKEAFYVVMGLRKDFRREILGVYNIPSESAEGWRDVLKNLKKRGLKKAILFIADGLSGLCNVIRQEFPTSKFQRCITHIKRGLLLKIRADHKKQIAAELRSIFTVGNPSYTLAEARTATHSFLGKWGTIYPTLRAIFAEENLEHYFAYLLFPHEIQRMIYTTNWIERLNRTIRRTIKIRASFPSPESALALISACLIEEEEKNYFKYPLTFFVDCKEVLEAMLNQTQLS